VTAGRFAARRRVVAFRCLLAYIVGVLQAEALGPLAGPGTAALAQLASTGDRALAQTARTTGGVPPEEEFGQGLAIVLSGFRAMLAEPSP
jgi:hypothetical protein